MAPMGPKCLQRFRGMFAFALLDQGTGSLFLARDQFGIKPLHYVRRKDGVVFASEIKASSRCSAVSFKSPRWGSSPQCSTTGARPDVLVACIDKLPPGTWGEFRPDGTHHIERYWDIAEEAAAAQEVAGTSEKSWKIR